MTTLGVNVAIIQNGQVLLTKREDFKVWCLPGGAVDAGESVAQAAVREAREETGLEVALTRLVGIYSRPAWLSGGDHTVLFAATAQGGLLAPANGEVLDARYFAPRELPDLLLWWHRQQIADAVSGVGGSVAYTQNVALPLGREVTRQQLYDMRDRGELPTIQVYQWLCNAPSGEANRLEVSSRSVRADV